MSFNKLLKNHCILKNNRLCLGLDVDNRNLKNTTNFKDRYGYFNETIHKQEKLKNYFRSFSFYKYLKNIEKKIFRTGRSKKKRDKTNSDETN